MDRKKEGLYFTKKADKRLVEILKHGGIGVMPTDTIYGIVGSVFSKDAVERIYAVRKRKPDKPFIVLIDSLDVLKIFNIKPTSNLKRFLNLVWPGPISIILPIEGANFFYLHRGGESLAFRVPKTVWLKNFLKKTGPLVAPSANIEGMTPALNIKEARRYFGKEVDFYLDKGKTKGNPSVLVEVKRIK